MSESTGKVFIMAPKDLQGSPTYERTLDLLREKHSGEEVVADRDLFEGNAHYRRTWKSVYGEARKVYILAREDGTVGKGIYHQHRYLQKRDVSLELIFEGGASLEDAFQQFALERLAANEKDADHERYAMVRF